MDLDTYIKKELKLANEDGLNNLELTEEELNNRIIRIMKRIIKQYSCYNGKFKLKLEKFGKSLNKSLDKMRENDKKQTQIFREALMR